MSAHMAKPDPEDTSTGGVPQPAPPPRAIDVRGPDERSACMQLAARWAEQYAPRAGDHERAWLERFRTVHDYVDDVIHGIEPQTKPS